VQELVELARRLFHAVQAAAQVVNFRRAVVEPRRLYYVDILFSRGVYDGGVYVKTPKLKVVRSGSAGEGAKAREANDRRSLGVVDAFALAASLCNKASLVPRNGTRTVSFGLLNPHIVDDSTSCRRGNKVPCLIIGQRVEFSLHGFLQVHGLWADHSVSVKRILNTNVDSH
jgi:hypothetical protein